MATAAPFRSGTGPIPGDLRMMNVILNASRSDGRLAALLDEAREYAQIYLLAKQRHKGCSGTGELMTLKEEFKDTVDRMVRYGREKKHLSGACEYDPDSIAVLSVKPAGS
jgi:hypothetical protein